MANRRSDKIPVPRLNAQGDWVGGDKLRLYAYTDPRTGGIKVGPGGQRHYFHGSVRPATRAEAEKYWQSPLHSGWKVVE